MWTSIYKYWNTWETTLKVKKIKQDVVKKTMRDWTNFCVKKTKKVETILFSVELLKHQHG